MNERDLAIVSAYSSLGVSVDLISVFTEVRNVFLAKLPDEVRADADDEHIVWRLVQLRMSRRLPTLPSEN